MGKKTIRIDIGAGSMKKEGYITVDIDQKSGADIIDDGRTLEKIKDGSVAEIRSSHMLEHLSYRDGYKALRCWYRKLEKGGLVVVTVPDVGAAVKDWTNGLCRDCCMVKTVIGSDPEATEYMAHKSIYWKEKLVRMLELTGYVIGNVDRKGNDYELVGIGVKGK